MSFFNNLIKKIKYLWFNYTNIMIVAMIIILTSFGLLIGSSNYNDNRSQQKFTIEVVEISNLIDNKQYTMAEKQIKELHVKYNKKNVENKKHILYLLEYLHYCVTNDIKNIKTEYIYTSMEYDRTSIFGDMLIGHKFLYNFENKKYKEIIHTFLTPSLQTTHDLSILIPYIISLQKIYGKNDSNNGAILKLFYPHKSNEVRSILQLLILKYNQ